ncbi:helix-turn-helix domain-containing protein [Tumebacillus lipolyticus]|uniref:Helix-turn-helix domain-containing protein n=1 Tax=Tumebacillus lipolyticus TaxID=1280370 RepID=A0ABW5A2B0_9BACL
MVSLQSFQELSLHYMDAQKYKLESRHSLELPTGEHSMFGFVLKGSVKVTLEAVNDRRAGKVAYGEVFLIPPNCLCTLHNAEKHSSRVLLIRFAWQGRQQGRFNWTDAALAGGKELRLYHFRMPRVHYWVRDFLNDDSRQEIAHHYLVQSHLYALMAEFAAFLEQPRSADDDLIEYVVQVSRNMLEHCGAEIDIEEIARLSGASSARFYQAFKRYTGLSPLKFITMVRLNESLRTLANSPASIKEVAHSVGYPDELYFSRLFKKHMGLSPTDYAASAKARVAILGPVFRGDLSVLGIAPVLELHRGWYEEPDLDQYVKQVEQCRPDLILTPPVSEELHRTLSQIAPVLMIRWKGYPWKARLLEISRAVQLTSVAERWLANFQLKVENARTHVRQLLGSLPFLVVSVFEPFFRVYGLRRIKVSDLFYDELWVTPPATAHEISFLDVALLDEVAALDCENILFLVPESLSDEECIKLEEEWLQRKRNRREKRCIFLRHEEMLLYNAAFYEGLVDQLVDHLISYRR